MSIWKELDTYLQFFKVKLPKAYKKLFQFKSEEVDAYKERIRTEASRQAVSKAKKEAKVLSDNQKAIELWRQHKVETEEGIKDSTKNYLSLSDSWNFSSNITILRLSLDKTKIETSKGMEIGIKNAKKFYMWLKDIIKNGGCENCTEKIETVLGDIWTVSFANKDRFKIGCHTVSMNEAEDIATQLGWNIQTIM